MQDVLQSLLQQMGGLHDRSLQSIDDERQRAALRRTADFVDEHMPRARSFTDGGGYAAKIALLDFALGMAPADGLVLEFGVATGDTLRRIAAMRQPAHGFDSFEGLPEDWRTGFAKGAFAMTPPKIPGATLHVGWFEDTLPKFFVDHEGPIAFAHLDADLYSSTVTIFREGEDRFVEGSILLFDEYFNYPGWEQHEHKAFCEFIERTGHGYEYVAYNGLHEQVLVRLTS
jgi:Methyltransferase domain